MPEPATTALSLIGPNQRRFIDELRTTTKRQGHGKLRDDADNYCCLGIACELFSIPSKLGTDRWRYGIGDTDTSSLAPPELISLLKLHDSYGDTKFGGRSLVRINDSDKSSFPRIADWLEAHPEQYFSEPA